MEFAVRVAEYENVRFADVADDRAMKIPVEVEEARRRRVVAYVFMLKGRKLQVNFVRGGGGMRLPSLVVTIRMQSLQMAI